VLLVLRADPHHDADELARAEADPFASVTSDEVAGAGRGQSAQMRARTANTELRKAT